MTDNQRSMSRTSVKWTSRSCDDKTHMLCFSNFYGCIHDLPWFIIPLLFLIHSWCVWQRRRLIQLWNPTRIRQSIGTKCHPPITPCSIGLDLICTIFMRYAIINHGHLPLEPSANLPSTFCSIGLELVCKVNGKQWMWFV